MASSSSRGSKLESDSCPDYLPYSEMERQSRVGDTRSSAGRPVHGATESDGCQPVRQTQPSTEQNRESKLQAGYTENYPTGVFSGSHAMAQRTQGRGIENPMSEQRTFGSPTFVFPTFDFRPSLEQRPFGSGTPANQMTFHPSSEQRPFGSGTPANPRTFHPSPEQRPFGSGTPANPMTFHPSPEQRPFGSGTPANPGTFHPSQEQRPFGSGTPANPMIYERQSSPEQRPLGSGTYLGQMTFRQSPEQRPFGSGTFVDQMTYERQASPVQRAFGSGTFSHPTTVAKQSLLEQRTFCSGPILSRSPQEQRTSSMSSAQLGDDDVMEDRDQQSDEEIRQNSFTTSMETFSIEDNDDTLPDQAAASVDPALFAQDEDGDTFLHMAIISERTDYALCLIHLAQDPQWLNLNNMLNQTPLHLATFRRQPKVIRRLLHGGAKRVVHDLRGNTPLHIACSNGHLDCVHELTSADPAVSVMTSDDLGFNLSNYEGLTCLHMAASKNHLDVIRYLVEDCGVNVNQKELRRGCTILHRAVATSNLTLLDYLLSLPASAELIIDEPTYDGYTALYLARLTKQTHVEQMLLSAGAHPVTYWPTPEAEM